MNPTIRLVVALVVTVVALAACQTGTGDSGTAVSAAPLAAGEFPVATIAPPADDLQACPAALITGILVEYEPTGLGLAVADSADPIIGVLWPFGYRGTAGPPVALVDGNGQVAATVDQLVEVGGGMSGDGWLGCGGVAAAE